MTNQTPFVQRNAKISPRWGGYSTALSSCYEAWAGLYDEHGQHTVILVTYD